MELDHVEAFVAIVRRGGFTRAAAALHLSQPAISRRLHLLEHELGAPLFDRVRAGATLTDAGRAFLPHAEALLASMRDGVEAVGALRGGDRGAVRLAVVGTLASTTLTERLRRFRERFPGIDLRATTAVVLIHRRRAYLGGAARALMATLTAWPGVSAPRRPSSARRRARSSGGRAAPAAAGRSSSRRSRA